MMPREVTIRTDSGRLLPMVPDPQGRSTRMLCGADYHQAAERIQRTRSEDPRFLVPFFFLHDTRPDLPSLPPHNPIFPRFRRSASELFTTLATVLQGERHLRFNHFTYLCVFSVYLVFWGF